VGGYGFAGRLVVAEGRDVEGNLPYGVGWTYVRMEAVMTPPGTSGSENAG